MRLKLSKLIFSGLLVLMVSGCATQANKDPLEGMNRAIYKFNDVTDKALIKPVAQAYNFIAPTPVRKGFNNFFNNLSSLTTVLNDLLQLKFAQAFTDAGRFVINSTFGLAGFIDVAGMDNIPNRKEDFGQTLGHWGVGNGPYLVLPFMGPSTLRDATGFTIDTITSDPLTYTHNIGEIRLHNQLRTAQIIDKRTELLDAKDIADDASLDPYAFMRDAYFQRRANLVSDGTATLPADDGGFEPADEDVLPEIAPEADAAEVTEPQASTPEVTEPQAAAPEVDLPETSAAKLDDNTHVAEVTTLNDDSNMQASATESAALETTTSEDDSAEASALKLDAPEADIAALPDAQ